MDRREDKGTGERSTYGPLMIPLRLALSCHIIPYTSNKLDTIKNYDTLLPLVKVQKFDV